MKVFSRISEALRNDDPVPAAPDLERDLAARALPHLSPTDQQIVTCAYGLDGGRPADMDSLATQLGLAPDELAWRQMSALLVAGVDRRRTRCPRAA